MSCNCLRSTYEFIVFQKPFRWWHSAPIIGGFAPVDVVWGIRKQIEISAETLRELEEKRDQIKKELEEKHGEKYHVIVRVI